MALTGKGFFTWKIPKCENGDANQLAHVAKAAGLTHLLIKIADGDSPYYGNAGARVDMVPAAVQALRSQGIQVWGWHYVYGENPAGEARVAIRRIQQLNLDGYVIDAESEYKQEGKKEAARRYMKDLRSALPNLPMALSSYRYPSLHPQLPWREFLEKCDINMPQVYWLKSHNAGEQLVRTVREFQNISPSRPIIPTGAAFREHGWQASAGEVLEFLNTAKALNLAAANFWEYGDARSGIMPNVWETIRDYSWSAGVSPKDICERYIAALNQRDPNKMVAFYMPTSVHVTSARTTLGLEAIRNWYVMLFNQTLPNANFILTGFSGTGNSRHLTWTATASNAIVENGNDTLGLFNGQVAYHYTFFTAKPL